MISLNKKKPLLFYLTVLMILSQTPWAIAVVFLAIPLLIHLKPTKTQRDSLAFKKTLFLKLILVVGFISSLFHLLKYDFYYFGRDIMYFIQAPIFIIIGIYLRENIINFKMLLKAILLSSFVVTIYKLIELTLNPALFFQLGLETRYEYSLSNSTALLVFTILFYARKSKFKLFKNSIEWLIMSISLFSVAISFSRTSYIILLVILIIPIIRKYKYILKIYWVTVFSVLFIIFGGLFISFESNALENFTFQSKMSHSLEEIIVKDYETNFEIMTNWRGYEAFLGLSKFYEGNVFEIFFGQGFGTVVYTPSWIFGSEENNLGVLPIFHNGFITILIKSGLVGLLFFFLFLYNLLKITSKVMVRNFNKEFELTNKLLQAAVFIILFKTLVVHGLFTKTSPVLLLVMVGAIIRINTTKVALLSKIKKNIL